MRTLELARPHIIHILPTLAVSGSLAMIVEAAQALPEYRHTLVHSTPLGALDPDTIVYVQAAGCDTLQTPRLTAEQLDSLHGSAAIFYNTVQDQYAGLGKVLPSIYYNYGWHRDVGADITISCSDYASRTDRAGNTLWLPDTYVIPPLVNTRALRQLSGPAAPFTVTLLTSGSYDKYPCSLAMTLLGRLPDDTHLLLTELDRYANPGMHLALDEARRRRPGIVTCRQHVTGGLYYTVRADVFLYGSASHHYEPYGRMVVEAMAMGKAVVVERRGVFANVLQHGVNALLYDTPMEALDHVAQLRRDTRLRTALGANAQLWASWQDLTAYVGKLKRILRMLGA